MKYRLVFTASYTRRAARFLRKHQELERSYRKTLGLIEINPTHPSLRLHKLKGPFDGLYSVSINISYRITIEFLIDSNTILPVDVGTHDRVY